MGEIEIDLELIPTDDLVQEIANRSSHGMVSIFRDLGGGDQSITKHWWGTRHLVIGLAQEMMFDMFLDLQDENESYAGKDGVE